MSTPPMDPYAILGVARDAQIADIRTAHRKLVLKCHPDKVQDPELKAQKQDEFQKVQEAYEVLSDETQRLKCDDRLKLAELRERAKNQPNSSAPRASPSMYSGEFEIRTAEPPRSKARSYRDAPAVNLRVYPSYTSSKKSYDDDRRGQRYHDEVPLPRRGESFSEKPSKRESEREREKREDRERRREKEKRKEREREEESRRAAEKAARKEAKRAREKLEAKEKKRGKEEKRREREGGGVYVGHSDDEVLPKKGSGKRYDSRDRSSGREQWDPRDNLRRVYTDQVPSSRVNSARDYISRSQTDGPPATYMRDGPPAAPSPPPASSPYAAPDDDDIRRSSARPRRGSAEVASPMPRERTFNRSSREPIREEPYIVDASPAARRARQTATASMNDSPPRPVRTNTMPTEHVPRAMPPRRSQTYNEGPEVSGNRGRGRDRMHPQAEAISSEDDEYAEFARRPKGRSSHKTSEQLRYCVKDGRATLQGQSYTRAVPQRQHTTYPSYDYDYEPSRSSAARPGIHRGPSYTSAKYPNVKMSQPYGAHDVQYSHFDAPSHSPYYDERSSVYV